MSALHIRVLDPGGAPIAARIAVRSMSDGTPVWPTGEHLRYDVVEPWGAERSFIADGRAMLDVPPGSFEVRVSRGSDWTDWRSVERLGPEGGHAVGVTLERLVDPRARGWVAGDVHVHRHPDDVVRLAAAEDIMVAHCLMRHVDIPRDGPRTSLAAFEAPSRSPDSGAMVVGIRDVEIERIMGGPGAIIGLDPRALPELELDAWTPFDDVIATTIRAAGGLVDGEKLIWPSIPVLAALGLLDTVEIACNHFGPSWTLCDLETTGATTTDEPISSPRALVDWSFESYAALLSCGFRIAASGGSGAGVMPNPVGASRVYARVDGPLSMTSWLAALRAGRTISTNGPFLDLDVDGAGPGDRLPEARHPVRSVRVRADSPRKLAVVELLADGEVVGDWIPRPEAPTTVDAAVDLDLSRVSWIAARAVEAEVEPSTIRFAHTSPIWTDAPSDAERLRLATARVLRWLEVTAAFVTDEERRRRTSLREPMLALTRARAIVEARAAGAWDGSR